MFKSKNQAGFSLLETIIAIAILGVIGAFSTDILLKSFQGGEKSQTISSIKQNGQTALGIIDRTIRSSVQYVCIHTYLDDPTTQALILYTSEGYVRFVIKPGTTDNGYIAKDLLVVNSPNSISDGVSGPCVADTDTVNISSPIFTLPANNRVYLTNTQVTSGVWVKEGSFTKTRNPGQTEADVINVYFTLGPPFSAPSTSSNIEEFRTTVKLFEK